MEVQWHRRVIGRVPKGRGYERGSGRWVEDLWAEEALDRHWMAAYRIAVQAGQPVVAEVRVFPQETRKARPPGEWSAEGRGHAAGVPLGGLPSTLLRQVRLGPVRELVWRTARSRRELGPSARFVLEERLGLQNVTSAPRRPGRRGRDDLWYATLAAHYVALIESGVRAPVRDLATKLRDESGEIFDVEYVRQLVHDARVRGLLGEAPPGRAGGELTARAKDLLGLEEPSRRKRGRRKR